MTDLPKLYVIVVSKPDQPPDVRGPYWNRRAADAVGVIADGTVVELQEDVSDFLLNAPDWAKKLVNRPVADPTVPAAKWEGPGPAEPTNVDLANAYSRVTSLIDVASGRLTAVYDVMVKVVGEDGTIPKQLRGLSGLLDDVRVAHRDHGKVAAARGTGVPESAHQSPVLTRQVQRLRDVAKNVSDVYRAWQPVAGSTTPEMRKLFDAEAELHDAANCVEGVSGIDPDRLREVLAALADAKSKLGKLVT